MKIENFPNKDQYIDCNSYKDKNGFEWKIATIQNGFIVGYFGRDYFKPTTFDINIKGKTKLLNNTGCFFFNNIEFETFYNLRIIFKDGYTYDIWEAIESFLEVRLNKDTSIRDCEKYGK